MDLANIRDISLLLGIWVAIYGIDSWRREFKGKRQIELAEEVLALFYEVSDAISHIRAPASYSTEYEAQRAPDESEANFEARKRASVVYYRYNQHKELFGRLHSLRYRFMATFGTEKASPFESIHKAIHEINVAARMLSLLWARDYFPTNEARQQHYAMTEKHEKIFWYQGDDDSFQKKVDGIVKEIEKTCRDIIVAKYSVYYFLNWKLKRGG
jgi:hypothetical protein